MSKIVNLKINNFRGIKTFRHSFKDDFICLIGRGDVSKTTILDAISYALSASRNISFYDTDFYNCNTNNSIEIEVTLINFEPKLISETKYYSHVRTYNPTNGEVSDNVGVGDVPALTVKLKVDKYLEPRWFLYTSRHEDIEIYAADREKFNCSMLSEYAIRHFSWTKGNPLHTLLNINNPDATKDKNIILEAVRTAKEQIDSNSFKDFSTTIDIIKKYSSSVGLNLDAITTTIDFRDIIMKDGQVCLHDEKIPFRLKGKGSKRLISLAIQLAIINITSGIVLIDEIEQGLEPDRVKQVLRAIKNDNKGQIFITTHSRDAIVELPKEDIFLVRKKSDGEVFINDLSYKSSNLQGTIRACSEAFFAKKIIICEGATEIGFCRAIDKDNAKTTHQTMSLMDCAYIDGGGDNLFVRAEEMKGYFDKICVFMDSDPKHSEKNTYIGKKKKLIDFGIKIFDCDEGNNIEAQVFKDLPWKGIQELLRYVIFEHKKTKEQILQSVKSKDNSIENLDIDSVPLRTALSKVAVIKDNEWFKRIDRGEAMGKIVINYLDEMLSDCKLKTNIENIKAWIS